MPRPFLARLLLVCCALALVVSVHAQSQATTGVIEGTVLDQSGAVLPGATVTIRNTGTNFERVVQTDADGRFRGLLLPLGPYRVSAALPGFSTLVREGLSLAVGASKELFDLAGFGDPSWKDLTWDVVGTAVGVGIAVTLDLAFRLPAPAPTRAH